MQDLGPPQPSWPLPFPCAGVELGQSLPSACLLAGGTACTCVGKLPTSQQAILSPAPFMAPEVSGGGWRTALAQRCKWERRARQSSGHHPLPGTGVWGRLPAPVGSAPRILATFGVSAA